MSRDDNNEMEKYGVVEDGINDEVKDKLASNRLTCPKCGSYLKQLDKVNVYICPKCGTKPFEKSTRKDVKTNQ